MLILFLTQLTIDLPFIIGNESKSLYGTVYQTIEHYHDHELTIQLIERMETQLRLHRAGMR